VSTEATPGTATAAQRWVLALTSMASFMVSLDSLVVSTALPTIRLDLAASIEQLEWTVNAYNLSFAVLLMTGAALGDRFGRRRMFTAGLTLFAAASAACALAPDPGWLIAARGVQGAGAALLMPLALAQLSAAFPPDKRAKALGIFSGVTGLAVLSGPVVGGAISEGIAWEWIFWLNVPIAAATIALTLTRLDETFGPAGAIDLRGVALVTAAALGIVWGLVRGNTAGWDSPEIVASLAGGAAFTVAFIRWCLRAPTPLLPMRLFGTRAFSAGNAVGFCMFASLYGFVFFAAQFLQVAQGNGPLEAGLRMLPATAMLFLVAPIAGARVNRIGERPLISVGLLLAATGLASIALISTATVPYGALVAPLIVFGAGFSMAVPAAQSAVIAAVAPQHIGKASGTFSTLRFLGGAFGIAVLVAVFAGTGSYASADAFTDGYRPAIAIAAALALAGSIAGLAIGGPDREPLFDAAHAGAGPAADAENVA
jgi:EmrB/QacA subfamily drug resistance transporter